MVNRTLRGKLLLLPGVLACVALLSCSRQQIRTEQVIARKQLAYDVVQLDSIVMTSPVFYVEGFFRVRNGHIYLFDYDHKSVQVFDTAGRFKDTLLTYHQIDEFRYGGFMPDGGIYLIDKNYQVHCFDSTGHSRWEAKYLNWQKSQLTYTKEQYHLPGTYSMDMQERPFNTRWLPFDVDGGLLIPLWISPNINKDFNRYRWSSGYYSKAAIIGSVDLTTALVKTVFGVRSPVYDSYNNIPDFDFSSADVRNDTIYVSQAIDSGIQVYTRDHQYLYTFGCAGQSVNNQYPRAIGDVENKVSNNNRALVECGYYYHLFCDPQSDLIFRTHTTGIASKAGLQIYRGNTLVAEAMVPARFNVIGKIGDWYYADGMVGGYNRLLGVYRFKLRLRSS